MRLIDADAVKADIEKFNRPLCDGYHMKDYVLNQIITDIENQPTVNAIPIEWIRNEIASSIAVVRDGDYDYNYASCILQLLERWEKENE